MKSEYTNDKEIVAFNQSNYPILIEVYVADENYISFKSNISARVCTNNVLYELSTDRAYFKHFGAKYYINECMTVGM
jgi:hypothetical protein